MLVFLIALRISCIYDIMVC